MNKKKDKKYKLGIIGCGAFGSFCIEAYKKMPRVEVFAVCRRNRTELKECAQKYHIPLAYDDYKDLIKNQEIDIVYIATPPFLHAEQAVAAAKHKKHLILEKPLALNQRDADKIIKTSKKNEIRTTINYVMRYNPIYDRVKEITKNKLFGKIEEVSFENYARTVPPKHWFWDKRKSGGILVEHGVHFFDIFGQIIGSKLIKLKTQTGSRKVLTAARYENGVLASFFHAFDKPPQIEKSVARVSYERGYAEIFGWLPLKLVTEGLVSGQVRKKIIKAPYSKERLYQKNLQDILNDLIDSIDNPGHKPKVTLEDANESLRIALLATKSGRLNKSS